MVHNGLTQDLLILRRTANGLILGDEDDAEVLLTTANGAPADTDDGTVRVFVHRDAQGRYLATTKTPKIQVGEFAQLQVVRVDAAGAHMEWGFLPPLLVPHAEQKKTLEEGRWYVVRMALEDHDDRLYGSTRIDNFLSNTGLTVQKGDKVALLVFGRSDLGLSVIVNNTHQGLVHANEVFKPVSIGDRLTGYVKNVRDDNKLDITLQPIGYRQYIDVNTAMLAKRLQSSDGYIPLGDKSSAEEIHAEFGISKKAFKKALGALYKDRLVRIEEHAIVWIG